MGHAFDRGAAGTGHLILEHSRVQAGFQYHLRGAQDRLGGQPDGHIARQATGHPAVAQGFNKLVHIGRAAAAEAGDGVQ